MKVTLNQKQAIKFQAFTLYPGENEIHQDFIDNAEPIFWVWAEKGRIEVPEQPQFEVDAEVSEDDDEQEDEPRGWLR